VVMRSLVRSVVMLARLYSTAMFGVRLLLVVTSVAACSKGGSDSPRALCEKIHPGLVDSLTTSGIKDVRADAKAEFIAACEVLPVEFLHCHLAPGDDCIEQMGDMELQSKLTAPLLARNGDKGRPPPPSPEVAEPIVQAIHDRLSAAVVRKEPLSLPDLELSFSASLCGKSSPEGDPKLVLSGATLASSVRADEERRPFPYGRAPGDDGKVILSMPFLEVKLNGTAKVSQRCGARVVEASVPVSLALVATPDLVIDAVDGSDPLRFRAELIEPKVQTLLEKPKLGAATDEIIDALGRDSIWTEALPAALAASPATIEAVGRLVDGP